MVIATWHGCRQRLSASRVCTACAGYAHPFHVCIPLHVSVYWCVYHVILTCAFCMSTFSIGSTCLLEVSVLRVRCTLRWHVSVTRIRYTRLYFCVIIIVKYKRPFHATVGDVCCTCLIPRVRYKHALHTSAYPLSNIQLTRAFHIVDGQNRWHSLFGPV